MGKQFHAYMLRVGCRSNVFTGSALLDMYAKCGCLDETLRAFEEMQDWNVVCWNAMVSAYAHNGKGKEAVEFFEEMLRWGIQPDAVTFLSVLYACSHTGLVEEGLRYFNSMQKSYNLKPRRKHYACMVDILGRVGRLDEVVELLNQIPFEVDEIIWNSVLNSLSIHGNQELARRAADNLFGMQMRDATPYVIMSNIYSKAGLWEEAAKVKMMMRS